MILENSGSTKIQDGGMMRRIPIIIDTDPGIDDAAALGLALYRKELDVKLITTVHGNVTLDKTTDNALKLLSFFDREILVARGMEKPLFSPFLGNEVHGESGLDGYDFPQSRHKIIDKHAVEAIYSVLNSSNTRVTLVPIGPLTNIAMLLLLYPRIQTKIDRIVLMGGSLSGGNVNSVAEFNIWADPHAAKIVFDSGLDIVMIGLDVTLHALIGSDELSLVKRHNKTTDMFNATFLNYLDGDMAQGVVMHDACAIAYLTNPEIFRTERRAVSVITEGLAKGMTMEQEGEPPNVNVAVGINKEAFKLWFSETLDRMV